MDKLAAEKIATEYYNAGIELALQQAGISKQANAIRPFLSGAGTTALGLGALGAHNPELLGKALLPGHALYGAGKSLGGAALEKGTALKDYLAALMA